MASLDAYFQILSVNAYLHETMREDSAGFDFRSAYNYVNMPRNNALIKTDLALKTSGGCYGRIAYDQALLLNIISMKVRQIFSRKLIKSFVPSNNRVFCCRTIKKRQHIIIKMSDKYRIKVYYLLLKMYLGFYIWRVY